MNLRSRLAGFLLLAEMLVLSVSCRQDSLYFPPGDGPLRFSADTLHFDTLFANVGSTTAWACVYNASDKDLLFDSVGLSPASGSAFRFSLDGLGGNTLYQVTLPARDSLFLFVELTPPWQDSPLPVRLEESICFWQAGESSRLVLDAWVQNAVRLQGKLFDADTCLSADLPYLVYDSLVVGPGATLRLEPGVRLHFHQDGVMYVYGTVLAEGTAEAPIVLRGDRLDRQFEDFPYEYYPGQWMAVYLGPDSYGNVFSHVRIRGGYYGILADSSACPDRRKLTMTDSEIFNMVYSGLYSIASDVHLANTVLANSGSYTYVMLGGSAHLEHCTIANYQVLTTRGENEPAVALVNCVKSGKSYLEYPLTDVRFDNCIIYGSREDEIGFGLLDGTPAEIHLNHCLVRSSENLPSAMDGEVLYNQDPAFRCLGERYEYDFHLDSLSAAIARGDTAVSARWPLDADGVDRLSDGASDLGAFEFILTEN